jgi:16S rRNA (guanine966-N2)-methyltransferase
MRVITGKAKGHPLKFPKGAPTRPATDLVRGAIFSILENMPGTAWDEVLDLYSGSGAMGIEALSRGAGRADFVDRDPRCCSIIKENLEKTRLAEQARVHCADVTKALGYLDREYDIVLMDPPYADTSIGEVIGRVVTSKLVGGNTTIVVTHSPRLTLADRYGGYGLVKQTRHGDSCINVYRKEEGS